MPEGVRRQQAPARRPLDETLLQQERLDDLLDRVARLRERGGDGLDPDRPTAEIDRDGRQIAPIHLVEADGVDIEQAERLVGDLARHDRVAIDDREIAYAPEQAPGDTRRATRALGDFIRAVIRHRHAEHTGAARHVPCNSSTV